MPRLSSQSKHEEFESNSTLQIRIRRKEGAEAEKEEKQRISHHSAKLPFLCIVHVFVDFLTSIGHLFGFFPNLPHYNSIFFWFLVFCMRGWL